MTRDDLEARIWAITGRELTGAGIDAIVDAAEEYAAERQAHRSRTALRHASGDDLWPLIGLLADAMLGEPEAEDAPLLRAVS